MESKDYHTANADRDADPEDLQTVHSMLMALKRKEKGQ